MSDDAEKEFGDAGQESAPNSADTRADDERAYPSRPFRSWSSAQDEDKAPSLWKRISGVFRRSDSIPNTEATEPLVEEAILPTNEYPAEATTAESAFESVEEALPTNQAASDIPFIELSEPPAEAKSGFLARVFGKKPKRASLEVEVHEERISAAADALEEVGEAAFAQAHEAPRPPVDAFASVEDALPTADQRFAPPESIKIVPEQLDTIRSAEATTPPPRAVRPELAETLDPVEVPVPYFDVETPVVDEIDEDTDEFEIAALQETQPIAPPGPGEDQDTAQVSRKSLLDRLAFWRAKSRAKAGAQAAVVDSNPVFLFSKFRTFYNEIIKYKHKKTEYTAGFSTAIMTDSSNDQNPDSAAEATSKHLTEMLELQAAEAMWMGGESAARYPDAQYAMAALGDETFLNMEWEGQAAWHKHLLETRIFRTRSADVELFRRIDALLKEQPSSAAGKDLARVYLMVIAAGFRGKYRQFGLTRALAEYRQRLYEYIHNGDALMLYAPDRRIFPDAAANTLEGHAVSRFSAAQRWAAILVFLVVSYTAIAHLAWTSVSADLKDVTDRIKTGTPTTGTR